MKKLLACIMTVALLLSGCTSSNEPTEMKLGLITTLVGLGDNAFNDMAQEGFEKAASEFGMVVDTVEPETQSDYEILFREFAQSGEYVLIMGMGNAMWDAMLTVSEEYPEQKFSIIDHESEVDNIRGIYSLQQEQCFISGVLAGLVTESDLPFANQDENKIGVFLGAEYPNILDALAGFEAGVAYVNPDAEVISKVAGTWTDPALGKTLANELYNSGCDVVASMAGGGTGSGVYSASEENGFYCIQGGTNSNSFAPDNMLGTSVRDVVTIAYNEAKQVNDGTWTGGTLSGGIKEGIVDFDMEGSNVEIPQEMLDILIEAESRAIAGDFTIPDRNVDIETWKSENNYNK